MRISDWSSDVWLFRSQAEDKKLIPVPNAYDVPMLSMGQLAKPGQAIAWRGPMAGNALSQLVDAKWDDVDILIVDLPPGTGDVQLSMIQQHKPAGAGNISNNRKSVETGKVCSNV